MASTPKSPSRDVTGAPAGTGPTGRIREHYASRDTLKPLDLLDQAVWVFDIDQHRIWWANRAAVAFWHADSLEDLLGRSYATDSETTRLRLQLVLDAPDGALPVQEYWTLYPKGAPVPVRLAMTPVHVDPDRRNAVLIEATGSQLGEEDANARRFLEATRYTSVLISFYTVGGVLISMNPAAAATYGPTASPPGRTDSGPAPVPATAAVPAAPSPGFCDRFATSSDGEQTLQRCCRDGSVSGHFEMATRQGRRWHRIEARIARDPATGEPTVLLVEEDDTERRTAVAELERLNRTLEREVSERTAAMREAMDQADQANRSKSDFLARMSHDLRTPLNAIIGFSEMLTHPDMREQAARQYQQYGQIIREAAATLLTLVDKLLDLSRIESGHYPIAMETVTLYNLLERLTVLMGPQFRTKKLTLLLECDQEIQLTSDPRAIQLIVSNLLSNSMKYTEPGGTVKLFGSIDRHSGHVGIDVIDTGIGIPADVMEQVFEPYDRGRADVARSSDGSGLGLAISRRLADLLSGDLALRSEPSMGTRASLRLPINGPSVQCAAA